MPCDPVKNPCPPTCPKVREQLRIAIKELPNVTDGIFPRKKNDVYPTPLPSDIISRDIRDELKRVDIPEVSVDHDVRPEELKDIEARPIVSQEFQIIQEPIPVIPIEKIVDDIKTDLIEKEKLIREPAIIPKEIVTPTEKIIDRDEEKIDFVKEKDLVQEPAIIPKETVIEKIVDDEEKIDLIERKLDDKPLIIQETVEETVIPTERIADRDDKKIDFVEEKDVIVERIAVEPVKKVPEPEIIEEKIERVPAEIDFVEEKDSIVERITVEPVKKVPEPEIIEEKIERVPAEIDFVEEKDLIVERIAVEPVKKVPEPEIIEEKIERVPAEIDFVEEKDLIVERIAVEPVKKVPEPEIIEEKIERVPAEIDFVEEKDLIVERIAVEPVKKVPEPEIIEEKIERVPAEIELEPSREEHFEPEEPMEYGEEEESITDYEKFIDEELQESLPVGIAREIPEEPRVVRREISRNAATYERIDRERPVRPALENSITERIVSPVPVAVEACDETCPLVKEQKERIMRKLKIRQRIVDHYYLTKGFSYFEDVCTCSLACMVYTLSRDPFVKSIFASLALFAIGLKLCSELDAWEMPNRVS